MTNAKIAIEKKLLKIKSSDIWVSDKSLLDEIKFINKGLAATTLFKDITIDAKIKKKATDMFDNEKLLDFSHMPFDDVSILADLNFTDAEGLEQTLPNGVLTRYMRSKERKHIVFITLYVLLANSKNWAIANIKAIDTTNGHFDLVGYDKRHKEHIKSTRDVDGHILEMGSALMSMLALLSYEPIKVEKELTFSERKHVPSSITDKYIEYTLDLSRPTRRRFVKSPHKGGSHASPCEHKRIGHWRTYKSGKVVRVAGSIVNKGSKTGVVEKDYSLGKAS